MKYIVTLGQNRYEVEVTKTSAAITGFEKAPVQKTEEPVQAKQEPVQNNDKVESGIRVTSPMPGTILSVLCSVGQKVKSGEVLMVLEAMKMENDIVAPADGTIKQLAVSKGSSVGTDDLLAVL